jgi:hypothetical protein
MSIFKHHDKQESESADQHDGADAIDQPYDDGTEDPVERERDEVQSKATQADTPIKPPGI